MSDVTIVLGGQAGQGIQTIEFILSPRVSGRRRVIARSIEADEDDVAISERGRSCKSVDFTAEDAACPP